MLQKQDQLALMESRLDAIDTGEQRRFYLATFRGDKNAERNTLLGQVDAALKDYGQQRSHDPLLLLIQALPPQ